ncbi:MAG: hypothetical protein U0531_04400 [Dehalococcoidia bacterium]
MAGALSVAESAPKSLTESLTAHLARRSTLLVLDNFEQVLAARRSCPACSPPAPA